MNRQDCSFAPDDEVQREAETSSLVMEERRANPGLRYLTLM